MSVFNPNDFTDNNIDINQILNEINTLYLGKTGFTTSEAETIFNKPLTINDNIISNLKTISPLELSQLDGINTNQTIQQQINGIGGGGTSLLSSNNVWGGTQQFNNNIIVNGSTLTPIELSYIDNTTSNIQTQLNTNSTNTGNNTTILSNNGITASTNIIGSINTNNTNISNINTILSNNQITSSTNVINTLDYLQSQISNLPSGSGSGVSFFLTNTTSTINNQYLTISNIPANSTNQILTTGIITNASNNVLMGQFITDTQLNITQIPAGIWDFNFYANLTNNNLSSYIIIEVYKYNGSATLLFTMTGDDINSSTAIIPYNINSTQTAYTVLTSDYLMIRIYGRTTSTQNITINIDYNSSNYYSHFHLPSIQRQNHNDLLNIQGGSQNDYIHLSTQQLNNINNPASTSQNGYLTSTDFNTFNNKAPTTLATTSNNGLLSATNWNTFNNKENYVIPGLTTQWYRGDKNWASLTKTDVGLSNVDNTTDLLKPISTAVQTALNLKQNSITLGTVNNYFKGDLSLGNNTDFITPRNGIIYVNGILGDNSNDGLSIERAYKTISAALSNSYINSGYQLQIQPSTYTGDITISQNNLSIISSNLEIGGLCNINGNIIINSNSTSIRLCGLTMNNLTLSGSANLYIQNCFINGAFIKSGVGYLSMNNIIFGNSSTFSITGSGNVNILNGCIVPNITINNTTALINISNNLYITKLIINAGIVSVSNTVIYGSSLSGNQFNCCAVNNNSFLYLNNCDLVDANNNTPYIISVASTAFYSLNNNTINYVGSSLLGTCLNRTLYFDNIASNGVELVNLNSVQTLINKTLNNPTLLNNIIKTSTGNNITFENTTDTIVNLSSNQTLSNKVLSTPQLINNNFRTAAGRTINFLDVADTVVNLNSNQTLTNKNISLLDGSTAITQSTSDNSNKVATTAYIKDLLSSSNSYIGTSSATSNKIVLNSTYQNICSIVIPVAGTYEINMSVILSFDVNTSAFISLFNQTTSTEVPNSLFSGFSSNITRLFTTATKTIIIQNIPSGTIFNLRARVGGSPADTYVANQSTDGFTYMTYKLLGLTNNIPLTNRWSIIGTFPFTIDFDDYTISFDDRSTFRIKKTTATTIYWGGNTPIPSNGLKSNYGSTTLTANTYGAMFFSASIYGDGVGYTSYFSFSDGLNKTYNIQTIYITATKVSLTIQSLI